MDTQLRPLDVLERLVNTAWQAGIAAVPINLVLFMANPGEATPLRTAFLMFASAALAALFTGIKQVAQQALGFAPQSTVGNLVYRFAWTAVAGFVGALPASFDLTLTALGALAAAGAAGAVAAVLSLAKNLSANGTVVHAVALVGVVPPSGPVVSPPRRSRRS